MVLSTSAASAFLKSSFKTAALTLTPSGLHCLNIWTTMSTMAKWGLKMTKIPGSGSHLPRRKSRLRKRQLSSLRLRSRPRRSWNPALPSHCHRASRSSRLRLHPSRLARIYLSLQMQGPPLVQKRRCPSLEETARICRFKKVSTRIAYPLPKITIPHLASKTRHHRRTQSRPIQRQLAKTSTPNNSASPPMMNQWISPKNLPKTQSKLTIQNF